MQFIGIDVGLQSQNTGVAVYSANLKKITEIYSCSFYDMQCHVHAYPSKFKGQRIGVVLENANLDNTMFRRLDSKRIAARMGRDVGKNQAGAVILIQQCKKMGIPCLSIAPSVRKRAQASIKNIGTLPYPTKSNAKQFKQLTGCEDRTNEHNRDAGTLVWGMTEKRFEMLLQC